MHDATIEILKNSILIGCGGRYMAYMVIDIYKHVDVLRYEMEYHADKTWNGRHEIQSKGRREGFGKAIQAKKKVSC